MARSVTWPLLCLILASVLFGAWYIERTSIVLDGSRVFLLWDDAMISMQYAKNFAEGNGLVWSAGGERVQGMTNLGITLLMAAIHLLPLERGDYALVVQLLNLLALAGIVVIVQQSMQLAFDGRRTQSLVAAASVALCLPLQVFSLQGADTGFVCLWLLGCQLVLVRGLERGTGWPRGLWALLAVGLLLRIDAAIHILPFAALYLRETRSRPRAWLAAAAPLAIVGLGILSFGQLYYGDPLPNTYYLKATGQPRVLMLRHGGIQLLYWLQFWWPALLLAVIATIHDRKRPFVQLAAGGFIASCAYHVWVGGDLQPAYGSRFVIPSLPLLLCLAVAGARHVCEDRLRFGTPALRRAAWIALALVAVSYSNGSRTTAEFLSTSRDTMLKPYNEQNLGSARFYRDHTREDTSIGLHWAGTIAYHADRPVVDLLGKSDRYIARMRVDRFQPGHSKWDWDYVVNAVEPDIINAESRGLLQRPDFRRKYVHAFPPAAPDFYVRRDRISRIRSPETRYRALKPPP